MPAETELQIDLESMNHSELVLLARWVGFNHITRSMPRKKVIEVIEDLNNVEFKNPINGYRKMMSSWLKLRWDRLQMQAVSSSCPNCEQCDDMRSLDCYMTNRSVIKSG